MTYSKGSLECEIPHCLLTYYSTHFRHRVTEIQVLDIGLLKNNMNLVLWGKSEKINIIFQAKYGNEHVNLVILFAAH